MCSKKVDGDFQTQGPSGGGLFYSSRRPPPNAPGWGIGGFCLRAQPLLYLRLASQLRISPLRSLFHLTKKLQTPGAQEKIKPPGFQEQSEVPNLFYLKKRGGGGSEATPWDVVRPPESRGAVFPLAKPTLATRHGEHQRAQLRHIKGHTRGLHMHRKHGQTGAARRADTARLREEMSRQRDARPAHADTIAHTDSQSHCSFSTGFFQA